MNQKEAKFVKEAAHTLRKVASERNAAVAENAQLKMKLAGIERRLQCEKVAAQMHQKNLNTDIDFPSLVTDLEKAASEGRLPAIEEAVAMAGPNMGIKTASIHETPTGAGEHDLERYLLGNIG